MENEVAAESPAPGDFEMSNKKCLMLNAQWIGPKPGFHPILAKPLRLC